mmetsp:Transcript_4872/g.12485  ORF Transcript_4872/g.12485 Transcript_4872/m.12485 type:complete len:256 (-) Transcript_4872:96-863(-)
MLSWRRRRRSEVQRWPQVPAAAKRTERRATSWSAEGMTRMALLPPSSRTVRPQRSPTTRWACWPTLVEPVKDTRLTRSSWSMASPTSAPRPWQMTETAGLMEFFWSTSVMIFCVAMETREEDSAPLRIWVLPQTSETAEFQPQTAWGKLKAVMIPTVPRGFQHSRTEWLVRSDGRIWPGSWRLMPQARSQMSMYSWTSPLPSGRILPISRERRAPRESFFSRRASPIWRTTSPRMGAGVSCHSSWAATALATQRL